VKAANNNPSGRFWPKNITTNAIQPLPEVMFGTNAPRFKVSNAPPKAQVNPLIRKAVKRYRSGFIPNETKVFSCKPAALRRMPNGVRYNTNAHTASKNHAR